MEILSVVKISLKILGLISFQSVSNHKKAFDIVYNGVVFTIIFSSFASSSWFLFFKTETFNDFSNSLIFNSAALLTVTLYSVLLQRRTNLIAIIRNLEEIIGKSMERNFECIK